MELKTEKIINMIKECEDKVKKIEGHALLNRGNYTKDLYMTLLSCIAFSNGDIDKRKYNFLKALCKGAETKEEPTSFLGKAGDLKMETLKEFLKNIVSEKLQYSFILDALILSAIDGGISDNESSFVGEIAEVLQLSKDEIEFLCDLCICILEEDAKKFNKIIENVPRNIDINQFSPYFMEFIHGLPIKDSYILGDVNWRGKFIINKPIINEGNLNIENARITFLENGKITSKNGSKISISNSEFINSEFILETGSTITAKKSKFSDNENKRVFVLQSNKEENSIENCIFQNCNFDDHGGAIYLNNSHLNMKKNIFSNCRSEGVGGAIYVSGENSGSVAITWSGLQFNNCEANYGGAIYESGNIIYYVNSCIFNSCKANIGSAVYCCCDFYVENLIEECEFNNCLSKTDGAVFIKYIYANKSVVQCRFNKCVSENGGYSCIAYSDRSDSFGNENIYNNCSNPIHS
ncbi:hypothetical protein N4T77_10440 [Clostridium sp. CX1]|uniref:hypothetical protein n=1 Tax=Clostridium sp. CX1 TaxID=2978346 RepID=UPI0021C1F9A6|nr:hypothetical protein [Clostridium sp. CX1]MCT8977021.1 hypothetical protein [Clostridium sp. CX1]